MKSFVDTGEVNKEEQEFLVKANQSHREGRLEEAIADYKNCLGINCWNLTALGNMAAAYYSLGRVDMAVTTFETAIGYDFGYVPVVYNYAMVLLSLGKVDKAVEMLERVVELDSTAVRVMEILADVYISRYQFEEAITLAKWGLAIDPASAKLYVALGNSLKAVGNLKGAMMAYRTALCLQPQDVITLANLGAVYKNTGDYDLAKKCLTKTLAIEPKQKMALYNLGVVYEQEWLFEKAGGCFDKAIEIDGSFVEPVRNKYLVGRQLCDFELSKEVEPKLDELLADDPFISIVRSEDWEKNFRIAKSWSDEMVANIPKGWIGNSEKRRAVKNKKIHVGYLSNDFREHPIGMMTAPIFGLHDRNKFVVSAYSYGTNDGSVYRKRVMDEADNFVDLHDMSVVEAAKKIRKDKVDILVDLTGYTENHRLEIMASHPARVQMTWLGFPGTSGAEFVDYLIADEVIVPKGAEKWFTEKVVRLPHCYQINDFWPFENKKFLVDRKDVGLPEKGFVFASFNQSYKIDEQVWKSWMRILKAVEGSVLCLWQQAPEASDNLIKEAKKMGVGKERLIFWESVGKEKHLERISLVDLVLDTRVYGGHTTTTDCLRMGVPVITKIGNHFASRVCASILVEVGLSGLVVKTMDEYEKLAIDLAGDYERLVGYKKMLAHDKLAGNLFNSKRFVQSLEKIYEDCLR